MRRDRRALSIYHKVDAAASNQRLCQDYDIVRTLDISVFHIFYILYTVLYVIGFFKPSAVICVP